MTSISSFSNPLSHCYHMEEGYFNCSPFHTLDVLEICGWVHVKHEVFVIHLV